MRLYVGNLSFNTEETQLEQLFAPLGQVEAVKLVRDRETGRSRGFAFVDIADDAARTALDKLNNQELDGRRLSISEARPQEPRGGGHDRKQGGGFGRRRRDTRW